MRLLHISEYSRTRLFGDEGYYKVFRKVFPELEHLFYVYGIKDNECSYEGVFYETKDNYLTLTEMMISADIIVLHSICKDSISRLKKIWHIKKIYEKRIVWVIWGHDLYDAYIDAHRIRGLRPRFIKLFVLSQIKEYYRKRIIHSLDCICGIKGDCLLASKLYKTNARIVPYNQINYGTPKPMKLPYKSYDDKRLNVMLCNHMDAHCRYIESLMKLSEIDNGKMVVYAQAAGYTMETPYVKEVVTIGEKLFKERFKAVFEWLSYGELCQQINNMDIGIFNIDRQMGQGTALLFAYYGKKVYFSKENTNYDSFLDDGIKVFRFDNIEERDFYEAPDMEFMDYNRTTIDELFDDKYFRNTWEEILAINK